VTNLKDVVVRWADQRIDEMLGAPPMWGSPESVELQVLQLVELRALALQPERELAAPRRVLELYQSFLREHFPEQPPSPLHELTESLDLLGAFRDQLARATTVENPFAHSLVAIKLTFDAPPRTSAVTGYYEEFRRAARAVVSGRGGGGRPNKDVEMATDFSLRDMSLTQPNGRPGEALLRLGQAEGQQNWEADARVSQGLGSMLELAEWAATDAGIDELSLDDPERRTRTALQARRLLPRHGIRSAFIGGTLVARTRPVELKASFESRFVQVVAAHSAPSPFARQDEIRAIDLDGGSLTLRTGPKRGDRLLCYVQPERLFEIAQVGVQARITGSLYRPFGSKPFVIAEVVEIVEDDGTLLAAREGG